MRYASKSFWFSFVFSLLSLFLLCLMFEGSSFACLVCHSKTGEEVRAGFLNENFLSNLAALGSPFLVFTGIVAMVHFWWEDKQPERRPDEIEKYQDD